MDVKPGYKLTEVGVIPEDWDLASLGELFTFKNGLNKGKEHFGYGTPIVNYMDVYKRPGIHAADVKGRVSLSKQEIKAYEVHKGDVFFTRTSETTDEIGMTSVMLDDPQDTVFSGFVLRARPKNGYLADQFKKYCFSTNEVRKAIVSKSSYTTRALTNGRLLSTVIIPLPSIHEQRAIAAALSDLDALITALDRLIAKKRDIKQAAMQELLTGKRRLPGFSGEWLVKSFGDVLLRLNLKDNQIQTSDYQATGIYPVVDQGKERVIGFSDRDDKVFRCPGGGVIVFGDHTCIVKFVDFDFIVGADGTQVLAAKAEQCVHFHALQLEHSGIFPTGYNRHFKFLKERQFEVPSHPEQTAIAAVLSDMDAEIATLEAKLGKTRLIKQGMMQELLTGRIRLV